MMNAMELQSCRKAADLFHMCQMDNERLRGQIEAMEASAAREKAEREQQWQEDMEAIAMVHRRKPMLELIEKEPAEEDYAIIDGEIVPERQWELQLDTPMIGAAIAIVCVVISVLVIVMRMMA